jgi:hypothetical protein
MRRHAHLILALAAAGCGALLPAPDMPETPIEAAARRAKATKPAYNLTGYPPAARDGYIDGCESAKQTSFARKDARRMGADPQYAMGWNDGFSICKPK